MLKKSLSGQFWTFFSYSIFFLLFGWVLGGLGFVGVGFCWCLFVGVGFGGVGFFLLAELYVGV